MQLAYVKTNERGATDRLLTEFADLCRDRGVKAAGIVQTNTPCEQTHHCDMDVKVLPGGPILRISQSLGAQSRGCRLDTSVLETAVGAVQASLATRPDLLIVNKFGRHEAEGRGFRELIAECLGNDIPVIVGIGDMNFDAFMEFSGGIAVSAGHSVGQVMDWAASLDIIQTKAA